jgi:hypothetical protein
MTIRRLKHHPIGALAQLVERLAGSEKVSGSNPLGSTIFGLIAITIVIAYPTAGK